MNVGPDLSEKIPDPGAVGKNMDVLKKKNPHTMFLKKVEEKEIRDIIKTCKNKKSTDYNAIDMALVKEVIEGVIKPLTHICNLSFHTGLFPNKMKIANVIPLYKSGNKHHFNN